MNLATPKPPDDSAEYKRKSILDGRFLLPVENLTNVRSKYISTLDNGYSRDAGYLSSRTVVFVIARLAHIIIFPIFSNS